MSDNPEILNYYTQRQWDRTVGWGNVPDEYSLLEYLKKNKELKSKETDLLWS